MGPSKRQLCYENDTEDGNTPKRHEYETACSNASQSDPSLPSIIDIDLVPSEVDVVAETTTAGSVYERICYGTICEVYILLTSNTQLPKETQPWDRYCLLNVQVHDGACYLAAHPDATTKQRSRLDEDSALIMTYVTNKVPHVSFSAVVGVNLLSGKRSKTKKSQVKATVNIYGPRNLMDEVDRALSDVFSYLQHPVFLEPDILYINPQFFYLTGEKTDLRHLVGPAFEHSASETSRAVDRAMECLGNGSEDVVVKGCPQDYYRPILDKYLLRTELKDHQHHGVTFILGREDHDTAGEIHKKLLMSVNPSFVSHTDSLALGGILADVMGLGKTLTMLIAILCSRELKKPYPSHARSNSEDDKAHPSHLTLVVLPSRQVLDVWKNEIDQRFQPHTFHIETFHGQARAKNRDVLLGSDIVLTTYHTLEKDISGNRILNSICWSRVVIDEAHHIRNPSTRIYKAVVGIQSETRWCLTGTPIQNSLDDLRSLLNFLRFEPFSQGKVFEEYIVKPFRQSSDTSNELSDPARNLRALIKACCLRRTQTKLDLPEPKVCKIVVAPTEDEKARFRRILNECRDEFDRMAGKETGAKRSNILFSAIMKLRRVCNHGVIEINQKRSGCLSLPKTKRNHSRSPSSEPACEFCSKDELEDGLLSGLDSCPLCSRILFDETTSTLSAAPSPHDTPSPAGLMIDVDPPGHCVGLTSSGDGFRAQSSKMSAVMNNIKTSCLGENSKNVVFSSWRDTLDILANVLASEGIPFVRVDGRNPVIGRTKLISAFRQDPDIKVLLISISTGALGLTLVEANKVHIVEPQWNPTIEDQAIARVVRMGQTRPVTIFKYITEGSVEQSIVKLQDKKTRIIKLSMQDRDTNESDMDLDRFKFTLDPTGWKANL